MSRKSYYGFGFILIKSCQEDCKIHKIQCTIPGMLFVCNKTSILMCPSVGVKHTHPFEKSIYLIILFTHTMPLSPL